MFQQTAEPATAVPFQPLWHNTQGIFNTLSGAFDFLHPQNNRILLTEICAGLSKLCRFNGQVRHFYSVAQHTVLVAQLAPPELLKEALVHDFAKAYIGDVATPIKKQIQGYAEIEHILMQAIHRRFGTRGSEEIKKYDRQACELEHRWLQLGTPTYQNEEFTAYGITWPPDLANNELLGYCTRAGLYEHDFDY